MGRGSVCVGGVGGGGMMGGGGGGGGDGGGGGGGGMFEISWEGGGEVVVAVWALRMVCVCVCVWWWWWWGGLTPPARSPPHRRPTLSTCRPHTPRALHSTPARRPLPPGRRAPHHHHAGHLHRRGDAHGVRLPDWGWGAGCCGRCGEGSLLVMYHRKRLVWSLPENHYDERFIWCLGCSTHVGIVGGGASGEGEGEREKEKGLFSLISPVGVVAGATSTPLGNRRRSPDSRVVLKPLHIFSSLGEAVGVLSCLAVLCCLDDMMSQSRTISSANSL